MKDFLIDSNTVYEKGMQGYAALTIIEENLNRLDELLKEASNEINKHDELNRMYYQSLESDIQYLRDYQNKYQSFIGGTYNVNGDGGFVGEYKDTVDDPYYKQKESLLDKLGDLKLEDITVDNKLGITTNVQAFVGHTTIIKDKVNIRDILGFGNISDNIKKQYEESKALIEKYNEGLNTYNESDYPSILPSFAKKLWYNLTKKKEKTIDNFDDYLDAIIKSGDLNFETEGEKKLSIGLDFIPVLGIGKMALEGLLGEDLVSGRDLNGLERILSVAPAGIGAIAKVKNAIKLGEIGGKVEGSISFGMNGGGQLEDIIGKLKKSKVQEDIVAKDAMHIDNVGTNSAVSKVENLGLDSEGNIVRAKRLSEVGVSDENIIKVIQSSNKPSSFILKKILSLEEFSYLDEAQRKTIKSAIADGRIDVSKWSGELTGDLSGMTREEWSALDRYLSEGKNVYRIPEGDEKVADFLIDGVKVEFKGLEVDGVNKITKKTLEYAKESFLPNPTGKGADSLLIDCISNNQSISLEEADKIAQTVKEIYPDKMIEIWTKYGSIKK